MLGGIAVVAIVVLSVFIPRAGLNVEIIERNEVMNSVKKFKYLKVNNNSPQEIKTLWHNLVIKASCILLNLGPFSGIFNTPDPDEIEF